MAVASPVVVLLVDLQLRQQSIPSSFEVPFFAAPTKETERARESTGMILDEQLDEFNIYWFQPDEHSAWVEMGTSWGQKSRPSVSLVIQVQEKRECWQVNTLKTMVCFHFNPDLNSATNFLTFPWTMTLPHSAPKGWHPKAKFGSLWTMMIPW